MVRLKETSCGLRCFSQVFQFHYGTIKSASNLATVSFIPNFNSTMVRLKAAGRLRGGRGAVFQFHYGTIKSIINLLVMQI